MQTKTTSMEVLKRVPLYAFVAVMAVATSGCREESRVDFKVQITEKNTVTFDARLRKKYGLGVEGSFNIGKVGVLNLIPETNDAGFGLSFDLKTSSFLRETWVNFNEVTTLPSGAAFPAYMPGPLVEVDVPTLNSPSVDWKFYFGVRGQYVVGVASLIKEIGADFPQVELGYTFYDKEGRVVLGLKFLPPKVVDGKVTERGGILVGTNLTPFLSKDFKPTPDAQQELSSASSYIMSEAAHVVANEEYTMVGDGEYAYIDVDGKDKRRVQSRRSIERLFEKYTKASQAAKH